MAGRRKRRGRLGRWFERVALGAVMGAVALVAERRLLRAIRSRDRAADEPRSPGDRSDVELALPAKEVDDQPAREQAATDPQERR